MKSITLIILLALVIVGCELVEIPDTEVVPEVVNEGTIIDEEPYAPINIRFNSVNESELEEIWRIETILQEDGTYAVDIDLSKDVTMSEAAKLFFDELTKYECTEWGKE